jgi:hypothetical protein
MLQRSEEDLLKKKTRLLRRLEMKLDNKLKTRLRDLELKFKEKKKNHELRLSRQLIMLRKEKRPLLSTKPRIRPNNMKLNKLKVRVKPTKQMLKNKKLKKM